jgi:hypothetical protein
MLVMGWEEQGDRPAECVPVVCGGVVVMTEKASNTRVLRLASGSRADAGDAFDIAAVARSIEPTVPLAGGSPLPRSASATPPGFVEGSTGPAQNSRQSPSRDRAVLLPTDKQLTTQGRPRHWEYAVGGASGRRPERPGPAVAALINS